MLYSAMQCKAIEQDLQLQEFVKQCHSQYGTVAQFYGCGYQLDYDFAEIGCQFWFLIQ